MINENPVFSDRCAGILLHLTSLPGTFGNGDLGEHAYRFVDFMVAAGLTVWQILPHGPTHDNLSPYQCLSAHAGNPLWISLTSLAQSGWLKDSDINAISDDKDIANRKMVCLMQARKYFEENTSNEDQKIYDEFVSANAYWLDDFALYNALRQEHDGQAWFHWSAAERDREPRAMSAARKRLKDSISQTRFEQFVFFQQWGALKRYANEQGLLLFGDLPVYVAHDSADVWIDRKQFDLDDNGQPRTVAGVPPDSFSETGQLWGNPQYRWDQMNADNFYWWRHRLRSNLHLYDLIRIDHFRGFESYWAIPGEADTAEAGQWQKAPGIELFKSLKQEFDVLPLVAEDLGMITREVEQFRQSVGLPGMKVMQFAFDGGADNPHLPHNHESLSVVYTGTHDNDTTLGWFNSLSDKKRNYIVDYLAGNREPMPAVLIQTAMASVSRMAIIPMQDFLGLGTEHRMNTPATAAGNWRWRFQWDQVDSLLAEKIRTWIKLYGRLIAEP